MQSTAPNLDLAKRLNVVAWIVSAVVLLLVGMMRRVDIPFLQAADLSFLPPFHASVNALTAVVLVFAYIFIRRKQVEQHKKAIYVAIALSVIFLLSYVTYHFGTPPTVYGDLDHDGALSAAELAEVGAMRTVYLVLLLSHIVLAAVIFPFILFTFIRAYTNQFDRHKKLARWVWPIWLYVAITGPVCYLMLRPFY